MLSFAANATIDIYFDDFINNTEAIITTLEELPYKDSMTNIAGAIRLMKEKVVAISQCILPSLHSPVPKNFDMKTEALFIL